MKTFPKYGEHNAVRCFNCGSTVEAGIDSGNPPNRGQYKSQECPRCKMRTWYDLIASSFEPGYVAS